jgi:ubiquinone/menaquinone biosynthesis C-methylase UbiE
MNRSDFSSVWKDGGNVDASGAKLDLVQHLKKQSEIKPFMAAKMASEEVIVKRADLARNVPGFKVLEIGVGLGDDLKSLAMRFEHGSVDVTGIDFNQEMVDAATATCAGLARIIKCDFFEARKILELHSFDAIRACITIQHLGDGRVDEILQIIRDLLKPGGIFVSVEGKKKKTTIFALSLFSQGASSNWYCADEFVTQTYDKLMPSQRSGGVSVKLFFQSPQIGFSIVGVEPFPIISTGALLMSQDPDWVKLKGMARMVVGKGLMTEEACNEYVARYRAACENGKVLVVSVIQVLTLQWNK